MNASNSARAGIDALVDRRHARPARRARATSASSGAGQLGDSRDREKPLLPWPRAAVAGVERHRVRFALRRRRSRAICVEEPRIDLGQLVDLLARHAEAQRVGAGNQRRSAVGQRPMRADGGSRGCLAHAPTHGLEAASEPISSERIAFCSASLNVRPIAIASPTDFICVVSVVRRRGNFSNVQRGILIDHVVDGRLEAGRRHARDVVGDLVEAIADRELRGDLRDRKAGRLRRQRRAARDARVHLDHDHPAVLRDRPRTGCSSRRSRRRSRG